MRLEYPLVHIYPQASPHEPVKIVGNTLGLCVLINTLIDAISSNMSGANEVFCVDGEFYEIQALRDDTDEAWERLELPYSKE